MAFGRLMTGCGGLALATLGLMLVIPEPRDSATATGNTRVNGGVGDRQVVVELFTSEGCSSCPPADDLLSELQSARRVGGAEIITLSEHVDYWNRLGWKDPFSNALFSARQAAYAKDLGVEDIYTPQMIVDGRYQFVGSNKSKAYATIQEAAQRPKLRVQLEVPAPREPGARPGAKVSIRVERTDEALSFSDATVFLALAESGLQSDVRRGENMGRKLSHTSVVRRLVKIGTCSAAGLPFVKQAELALDPAWNRSHVRAVVFVQEQSHLQILGAGSIGFSE